MKGVLEELWYGNVCPNTQCRGETNEARKLTGYIADHYDNLRSTLTQKQKELLENMDNCYDELMDINEREIFSYAFRLGAKIAIEIMSFEC